MRPLLFGMASLAGVAFVAGGATAHPLRCLICCGHKHHLYHHHVVAGPVVAGPVVAGSPTPLAAGTAGRGTSTFGGGPDTSAAGWYYPGVVMPFHPTVGFGGGAGTAVNSEFGAGPIAEGLSRMFWNWVGSNTGFVPSFARPAGSGAATPLTGGAATPLTGGATGGGMDFASFFPSLLSAEAAQLAAANGKKLDALKADVKANSTALATLSADLGKVKAETATILAEVGAIKADVATIKKDVATANQTLTAVATNAKTAADNSAQLLQLATEAKTAATAAQTAATAAQTAATAAQTAATEAKTAVTSLGTLLEDLKAIKAQVMRIKPDHLNPQ